MTRWASALVALLMIGSVSYIGLRYFNFSQAATPGTLFITPASGSFTSGSTVSFTVYEESGATPVNGVQFDLNYNSSQLQYLSNSNGAFTAAAQTNTATAGLIRVFRGASDGLTGQQAVVTLNFKLLATSGSTTLSFNQGNSFMTNANDSSNALQSVQGATFSVASSSAGAAQDASLTVTPASGTLAPGSTVTVAVRVNSPTQGAFAIQSVLQYPANQLQYQSFENSPTFPTATRSNTATAGTLDFVRGVNGGDAAYKGQADVVKFTFKVIGASGTAGITVKTTGAGSNSSVLDGSAKNMLGSTTGANFAISSGDVLPPPPPPPVACTGACVTPTQPSSNPPITGTQKSPVVKNSISYTPRSSAGSNVALGNDGPVVQGSIDLAPVANPEILADNPGDIIVKVEYLLGDKNLSTKTTAPFTYSLDSTQFKNGKYDMTIKTTYESGQVDLSKETILVNNKVTLAYILQHYLPQIVVGAASVAGVGFVGVKYLLPRFGGGFGSAETYDYGDGFDGYSAGAGGPEPPSPQIGGGGYAQSFTNSYEAPDPMVITPANATPPAPPMPAEQVAAAQVTQPIDTSSTQYDPAQGYVAAPQAAPQPAAPETYQPVQAVQPPAPDSSQPAFDPYGRPVAPGTEQAAMPASGQVIQPAAPPAAPQQAPIPPAPGSEGQPQVKYDRKYF